MYRYIYFVVATSSFAPSSVSNLVIIIGFTSSLIEDSMQGFIEDLLRRGKNESCEPHYPGGAPTGNV